MVEWQREYTMARCSYNWSWFQGLKRGIVKYKFSTRCFAPMRPSTDPTIRPAGSELKRMLVLFVKYHRIRAEICIPNAYRSGP